MISRAMGSARHRCARETVLAVLACGAAALAATLALASPAAAECPNEALRQESNMNAATGQPYSAGLPDCRAYEMVSPIFKQGQQAVKVKSGGLPAAPGGEAAGWASQGDFSNPENYTTQLFGNVFLSQRGASGWITSSAFAPRNLVDLTLPPGLEGDTAPDLHSVRASCGLTFPSKGERETSSPYTLACARREGEGSWVSSPAYTNGSHEALEADGYLGGSADLSRLFIQPSSSISPADKGQPGGHFGIYELAGCCSPSSTLRLVNEDNEGKQLVQFVNKEPDGTVDTKGPLLGDARLAGAGGIPVAGSEYHAISESGGTVFFTATPNNAKTENEAKVLTVYARIHCVHTTQNESTCSERGNGESFETVAVSNPSQGECGACKLGKPKNATFQGASADGSKVFFTTEQELLSPDPTYNLYEYDFNRPEGERLVLLSRDAEKAARVSGVVRSSPDGSHVYFVATGALKVEKNANGEEANGNGEKPEIGNSNLYGYDTVTGETKFVVGVAKGGTVVSGVQAGGSTVSNDSARQAQTTPDGRYLVFSSPLKVSGDTNSGPAVYRYDFQTGALEWVSHGAPGFPAANEGKPAVVSPLPATSLGANANIDDWNRTISNDGEYIVFTTAEELQGDDENNAPDVYEWHHGTVTMISDGHDPLGVEERETVMSASGSDIFFLTRTQLVGQDTDALRDLYDARAGGGFPRPQEVSCSGEACQGSPSASPTFGSAASSVFTGGANLTPPQISVAHSISTNPKPLTRAQQLAKALRACKGKPKRKRATCESQARKKYGGKAKAKKSHRRSK